ncbi:hypothetical protein MA16_Dca028238 [Dendrobium catenatum]|uniref:RNase H type-1 domain-containing protein n=1 Tax=Dendrobium catenatum TaxID=906689 RepID=A0A2I0VH04_9ASPA|nr:hypothetical protein MA16_Dca028238 [Dendrobium catenatum]
MRKIRNLLSLLNFKISHIFREGNVCANWLANKGAQLADYEEIDILNLDTSFRGMISVDKAALPHIRHG